MLVTPRRWRYLLGGVVVFSAMASTIALFLTLMPSSLWGLQMWPFELMVVVVCAWVAGDAIWKRKMSS
jgi:hypothetical protein